MRKQAGQILATVTTLIKNRPKMNPLLIIRILAVGLIALFGLGILAVVYVLIAVAHSPVVWFALVVNIGFVIGGIGLFMVKRWSWWLTLVLCAVSLIQFLWQLFATLTAQTATELNEIVAFIVAGFYLGIAFVLTSGPVRKAFKERNAVQPPV
jgi:hypothetical protein